MGKLFHFISFKRNDIVKTKTKLQSVGKMMTAFGEFSSIPILGKTPPPSCTMLTRHEMTILPERVINIDWEELGKRYIF